MSHDRTETASLRGGERPLLGQPALFIARGEQESRQSYPSLVWNSSQKAAQ